MRIVPILEKLLNQSLSLDTQCELLEKSYFPDLNGQDLFHAVEYLYNLTNAPQKALDALDIVGTGGDQKGLFNISTASSFVIAGMGIPVLKHGNSKISSQSGSIDCLKVLKIGLPESRFEVIKQFSQTQLSFLSASHFYPIFFKIREARKKLAERNIITIFNVLGPLLNPFRPTHQLVGVFTPTLISPISEALFLLKRQAFVFCCQQTDELIPGDDMHIVHITNQCITKMNIKKMVMSFVDTSDLKGGSPNENADTLLNILKNKQQNSLNSLSHVILFNAAFADMLYSNTTFETAYLKAQDSLISGAALKKLHEVQHDIK